MSVGSQFRATRIDRDGWVGAAPALGVEPEWVAAEIDRQGAEVVDAVHRAASRADVAHYDSATVRLLLRNVERWVKDRV